MTNDNHALRAIIDAHRELADKLEKLLTEPEATQSRDTAEDKQQTTLTFEGTTFDPQRDQPESRPDPQGTPAEKDWCILLLFGKLRAINQRKNRGATKAERLEIAQAAGYRDARAWAGWSPSTWVDDENGGRWLNETGMDFLRHYYTQVNRVIPDDLA